MAERDWKEPQIRAFSDEAKNILVSAAAGSGKTAVLIKRITRKLTDKTAPSSVLRMLVVTFTKAAAAELKERIGKALNEAIAEDPSDKRLKRQYVLLQKAKISTIHGFCYDLIKKNFEKAGCGPNVRVSDPTQTSLLMGQVAELVIDSYYASLPEYDDIEDFHTFADNFMSLQDKEDKLASMIIMLYKDLMSSPKGVDFLSDCEAMLSSVKDNGIDATVWGDKLIKYLKDAFLYYSDILKDAVDYFTENEQFSRDIPAFENDHIFATRLYAACGKDGYGSIRAILSEYSSVSLGRINKLDHTDRSLFFRGIRESFGKFIQLIIKKVFSHDDATVRFTAEKSAVFIHNIYLLISAFDKRYSAEKRKRNIIDFNDLERIAYSLLVGENGEPTDIALSVSSDYDDIYIDEYQDVNKLQDMIFSAISVKNNRFMVGDIKQSIYGFRAAEPSLFASYRQDPSIHKVFLSNNFRCDLSVIDFTNHICGRLFRTFGTTVPYDSSDELVFSKKGSGSEDVEINLIETGKAKKTDMVRLEAEFTAKRTNELIKDGVSPSDICILLRSAEKSADVYRSELMKYGIPCNDQYATELFENPEVLLVMSILNLIDNPTRDIYLAAALKSPIFNFSLDDLIKIRSYSKKDSLFSALAEYTADKDFDKGQYFFKKFEKYRSLSFEPVDRLIWAIYRDTNIFALSTGEKSSSAESKKANLLKLYDFARCFESGSFKGLYNFIRYINDILDSKQSIPASSSENENAVNLMTIHHSKGLEFPIVFLCGTGFKFSSSDLSKGVLFDKDIGVALKLFDDSGYATYDTVMRFSQAQALAEKNCEEEIRVLYVALTRAQKKLIINAAVSEPKKLITSCELLSQKDDIANGFVYRSNKSFISWILMANRGKYEPNIIHLDHGNADEGSDSNSNSDIPLFGLDEERVLLLKDMITERFSFEYDDTGSIIPAKLAVSDLYPSILDEDDSSLKLYEDDTVKMKAPKFIKEEASSSAEVGTATHQFMQFCDFELLREKGFDTELLRLTERGFLDGHTASLVKREAIEAFLSSELYLRIKNARYSKRELRFNIRFPAGLFTEDLSRRELLQGKSVLVQGIMDLVIEDADGKLMIIDYKTDRLSPALSADEAEDCLVQRHRKQLAYYKYACEKMMCKKVDKVIIYSFDLGHGIEIPPELLSLS